MRSELWPLYLEGPHLPISSMYVSVGVCNRWLKMACVWTICSESVYSDRTSETWCWRQSGSYNLTMSHTPLLNGHTAHYRWWRTSIQRYPVWQLTFSSHSYLCIHYSFILNKIFLVLVLVVLEPFPVSHHTRLEYSLDGIPVHVHTFTHSGPPGLP